MLWSLWLWDVLHAVHSNHSLSFSSDEVLTTMPSSTLSFPDVYRHLLRESSTNSPSLLSATISDSRESAVILLLAVLSDCITIRRSLGSAANIVSSTHSTAYSHDPFVPFSAHDELERMQNRLSKALERWQDNFRASVGSEVLTLFHYCELYLSCPALSSLSQLAQYDFSHSSPSQTHVAYALAQNEISISDRALDRSWALLDVAAKCPKSDQALCAAWMPIVVFHAALVIWAKISLSPRGHDRDRDRHGSIRVLLAFKLELEAMPWPCCRKMATTLQKLMSS